MEVDSNLFWKVIIRKLFVKVIIELYKKKRYLIENKSEKKEIKIFIVIYIVFVL